MFTLKRRPERTGAPGEPAGIGALYLRAGVPGWLVQSQLLRRTFLLMTEHDPAALTALAARWGALAGGLPRGALEEGRPRRRARPPAVQEGWVRATGQALCCFPELEADLGGGRDLVALADKDTLLRSICNWAGQGEDGARDLRGLNAAFGWFQVYLVLDALRTALPRLAPAEAEALLAAFTPMLALVLAEQGDEDGGPAPPPDGAALLDLVLAGAAAPDAAPEPTPGIAEHARPAPTVRRAPSRRPPRRLRSP